MIGTKRHTKSPVSTCNWALLLTDGSPQRRENKHYLTWPRSEHGQMRLDLIYIESLQQRGSLVGPQGHPLPLGSRLAFRAFPRPLGHAPVGLHHVLQTRVHLLGCWGCMPFIMRGCCTPPYITLTHFQTHLYQLAMLAEADACTFNKVPCMAGSH